MIHIQMHEDDDQALLSMQLIEGQLCLGLHLKSLSYVLAVAWSTVTSH